MIEQDRPADATVEGGGADTVPQTASAADGVATDRPRRSDGQRTLVLVVVLGLLVVGGIVGVAASQSGGGGDGATADLPPLLGEAGAAVGEPVPEFTLPALGDLGPAGGLELPAAGEPMVINFWASWCAPCVNEMPMLQRVAEDTGITMIGVDYIDQADKAIELAAELGITYTLVRDDDGEFGQLVGLLGTPTTLLVDADGVVRRQLTGELTEDQLRQAITDAL